MIAPMVYYFYKSFFVQYNLNFSYELKFSQLCNRSAGPISRKRRVKTVPEILDSWLERLIGRNLQMKTTLKMHSTEPSTSDLCYKGNYLSLFVGGVQSFGLLENINKQLGS